MKLIQYCVIPAMMIALTSHATWAACGGAKPSGYGEGCCSSCEPARLCCQNEVKTVTVKKHCYEVECEDICIPPVTLPKCSLWGNKCCDRSDCCSDGCGCGTEGCQDSCGESCGPKSPGWLQKLCSTLTACRIRQVNRMKKKEYEVEECVCEWSVVCLPNSGCAKGCADDCGPPASCCAPCGE